MFDMEERQCHRPGCLIRFKVLKTSTQKGCSREHGVSEKEYRDRKLQWRKESKKKKV